MYNSIQAKLCTFVGAAYEKEKSFEDVIQEIEKEQKVSRKEAERLFPNEKIIVGAMDGADEELIQNFLNDVLEYEIAERNLNKRK